eukprot:GFUD01017162.1.p1 GENE.GFUD01017162.1~~GFUD01017162.1.p1  ORF type:complete len:157 (-),score=50.08 GFUD01017162.1:739-1209(-)
MDPDRISSELLVTCANIEKILSDAKEKAKDLSDFVENKLGPSFGPAIGIYASLFKALNVNNREELEEKVKSNFRHVSVQDSFESLLEIESHWNTFLSALDEELRGSAGCRGVSQGDKIETGVQLDNARTGQVTSLSSLLDTSHTDYVHLVLLRHFA